MKTLIVIPARFGSTRFPGKPLALINGKPMIRHVWERCSRAVGINRVIVATDDRRILEACGEFGAEAVMTDASHPSGTHRVAQAVREAGQDCEAVINVQGDEPGIDPRTVEAVAAALRDPAVCISTAVVPLASEEELRNPHVVKAVMSASGDALYFSRAPVPHVRDSQSSPPSIHYRHLGIYGYRRETLLELIDLPPSSLELAESLEQLRWLEAGYSVRCVQVPAHSISVDTPADLERAEHYLTRQG